MKKATVIVNNENGLDDKVASKLAVLANKYQCTIKLSALGRDRIANAKSLLNLLVAGFQTNEKIEIECDGTNEEEALNKIVHEFKNNFSEE